MQGNDDHATNSKNDMESETSSETTQDEWDKCNECQIIKSILTFHRHLSSREHRYNLMQLEWMSIHWYCSRLD